MYIRYIRVMTDVKVKSGYKEEEQPQNLSHLQDL
jgi:hypothetical protein